MKTYTLEQIKTYITKQDSLGDVLYNLTEEKVDKALLPTTYYCLSCDYEQTTQHEECEKCGSTNMRELEG